MRKFLCWLGFHIYTWAEPQAETWSRSEYFERREYQRDCILGTCVHCQYKKIKYLN